MKDYQSLFSKDDCEILLQEPMRNHTTFKIGGPCKVMFVVKNYKIVPTLLKVLKENNEKIFVLGKGANVLFLDEGYDGVVIKFSNKFAQVQVRGNQLICDSGVTIARMSNTALDNGFTGAEFAWGIPGTVGGAVCMNAGAYHGEFSEIVKEVHYIDENYEMRVIENKDLQFGYRHSFFTDNFGIIIRVIFAFETKDKKEIKARMDKVLEMRLDKQPYTLPSAGSTFKRPEGAYAAALIEECGLKGYQHGDAEVSRKHSGFVVNNNKATSKEVLELIEYVKQVVKEKTGYQLECEVKIVS